jgi:hypothetical protein
VLFLFHAGSRAAILEVGPGRPYESPEDALAAAAAGDTVLVDPGLYLTFGLIVDEGVTLAARREGQAVIAPNPMTPADYVVEFRDGATARGFWIVGAASPILAFRDTTCQVTDCVISSYHGVTRCCYARSRVVFTNCTIWSDRDAIVCEGESSVALRNSIVFGSNSNLIGSAANISARYCNIQGGWPGEGNIDSDPMFMNPQEVDYWQVISGLGTGAAGTDLRLRPGSPCIDAGYNDAGLQQFDIAGMHRIMWGGKSLTVDMGAYEHYINDLKPGPEPDEATFTWSSLADKTYSIFHTGDLLIWHLVIGNFPSAGNETTSWIDDGTLTGVAPLLAPRRFYRILENP